MPAEACLTVLTKISQEAGNRLRDLFESLKDAPTPGLDIRNLQDPRMLEHINNLDLTGSKKEILKVFGFANFEPKYSSFDLIGKLTQLYKKKDSHFLKYVVELDKKTNVLMDTLM